MDLFTQNGIPSTQTFFFSLAVFPKPLMLRSWISATVTDYKMLLELLVCILKEIKVPCLFYLISLYLHLNILALTEYLFFRGNRWTDLKILQQKLDCLETRQVKCNMAPSQQTTALPDDFFHYSKLAGGQYFGHNSQDGKKSY